MLNLSISSCLTALEANRKAVLCHSMSTPIDAQGTPLVSGNRDPWEYGLADPPIARRHLGSPSPARRFADVLLNTSWCYEIFGLIRRTALASTSLQDTYYGADKVLLAELALVGPWEGVPEQLWQRRCHADTSTSLDSVRAKAAWSNPAVRRIFFPVGRMVLAYLNAVHRHRMSVPQLLGCHLALLWTAVQPDKFRKLLLPGPHNYFGFSAKRASNRPALTHTAA